MKPFRPLLVILLLLLLGIDADCAYPPKIPLEVWYAGCRAVSLPGPVCVIGKKRILHLWAGAPLEARIKIRVGGERSEAIGEPVQGGLRFSLTLPLGTEAVDVLVETPEGAASWSMSFVETEREISRDVMHEIQDRTLLVYGYIQNRQLAAARKTMKALLQLPPESPAESHYQRSFYGGLLAEKEGDYREALAKVQDAVEIAERVQLDSFQLLAEEELALLLCGVGRFREVAQLFDRLGRTPQFASSCEEAQFLNNQAWSVLLAREAGESLGDPTRLLEKALETYETCEDFKPEKKVNILINLALAHLQERRLAQAKDFLARSHKLEPHARAPLMLWWLDLEARIVLLEGRPAEALHLFSNLQELALATSSADGRLRAASGQAGSLEALGKWTAALETLRQAEALLDEQSLQIPLHEGREMFMATRQAVVNLHVELLLDLGRPEEALAVAGHGRSRMFRQLERSNRLANLTPEKRDQWESLLVEYQQRRATLEERAREEWRLPEYRLPQERSERKAEAEAVKKLLDRAFLLLEDPGEQPVKEPRPPRPGELILAYYPLPHGWAGFAADGTTVVVHLFELPPDIRALSTKEQASRLLLPFRAFIERAQRIRILPSGPLLDVDFHALPFDEDILLAKAPVVYGLDLPVSAEPAQAPGRRRALLVADPRDDLPGALAEVRTIGRILVSGSRPWITEELKSTEASVEAVRRRFAEVDLLHYAGHGTFSELGGWESGLLLAQETRLTLGDILALERVPSWVVLSGCQTGRSSNETPVESLGLAQAFLLAGSQAVVASTRPADDRKVPAFFIDLYRQWDREPDLAVGLQHAQLFWRQRNPSADWPAFRLFEP